MTFDWLALYSFQTLRLLMYKEVIILTSKVGNTRLVSHRMESELNQTHKTKLTIGTKKLDWVPIILSGLFLAYWWQPWMYLTVTTSLLLLLNFCIVGALLLWADGYEREPVITVTWSILWGCFVAISITSLITPGEDNLFVAAIVEEASKLLGLFWIYKRGSIHSATDALVMAGLIGLGFTVFEDFTYSAGSEDAISILIFRAIFSVFAHTFFSGVGAAIMYVLWQKLRGAGIVLGFIFSFLIHYLWNLSQSIDLASINLFLYFIIYAAWPPVVLLITCILVRQKEAAHIISNGARAVGMGVISQNELDQVLNRVARRAALKQRVTRSDKKEYKRELNARARTILEFDSYSLDEFNVINESFGNQDNSDPWTNS
jgi:RsiW-degrading membrane proteinase PrsW (M82 family)